MIEARGGVEISRSAISDFYEARDKTLVSFGGQKKVLLRGILSRNWRLELYPKLCRENDTHNLSSNLLISAMKGEQSKRTPQLLTRVDVVLQILNLLI
jgi:hypothetical protein